jgi:hypothetical protein
MDTLTKKDLEPIRQAVESLTLSAKRIETALLGDEAMRIEGIASKVHRHETHIEKSKARVGWITGVSTGLGFILHYCIDRFKNWIE